MPNNHTQRGQRLDLDVLGEALASSPAVLRKGLAQFETPPEIAAALCTALNPCRPTVADLQCGHGSLLRAAANVSCGTLFGLDIDPSARIGDHCRATAPVATAGGAPALQSRKAPWRNCQRHIIHGDCTQVVPLLEEAGVRFDLLVLNPPWGLRWISDFGVRKADVGRGTEPSEISNPKSEIDSTLWTFEAAHRLLTAKGEGMLIARAGTVRRLLEPHPLWGKTWLRLSLRDFFGLAPDRNTGLPVELNVLYFAATHEGGPTEITL